MPPGHEDAIEVYTPERPYTIYTRSSNEKRLWVAKLRETIYHHLYKENKCHRSDTCDTCEDLIHAQLTSIVYTLAED